MWFLILPCIVAFHSATSKYKRYVGFSPWIFTTFPINSKFIFKLCFLLMILLDLKMEYLIRGPAQIMPVFYYIKIFYYQIISMWFRNITISHSSTTYDTLGDMFKLLSISWETFVCPPSHTQWRYFCRTLCIVTSSVISLLIFTFSRFIYSCILWSACFIPDSAMAWENYSECDKSGLFAVCENQ